MTRFVKYRWALIVLLAGSLMLRLPETLVPPANANEPAQTQVTYYANQQVIISGRAELVDRVVTTINASAPSPTLPRLTRIQRSDLSYTDRLPPRAPFLFPPGRDTLVLDLYNIVDNTSVPAMVRLANSIATAAGVPVYTDPNYAVGRPPVPTAADGWSAEPDPSGGNLAAGAELFWGQWAFGKRGIGLFQTSSMLTRSVPFMGTGVQVAVFDTSAFGAANFDLPVVQTIDWISPTLQLEVLHPTPAYVWPVPAQPAKVQDHGLFAAGMVHAVAPNSRISLIRVLDQYGQGDLYTLTRALHRFTRDVIEGGPTAGAVINLSLGVHLPPAALEPTLPREIRALEVAAQSAEGFKVVVVAAAGNDSNQGGALAMQLPAAYKSVIGVAGSTSVRGRSCFSNQGDVAAPGGDGSATCLPVIDTCVGPCAAALVGLTRPGPGNNGYAYWTGTSFATPLGSGVAALLLDAHNGALTSAEVAELIYAGALPPNVPADAAALGAGIIDLRRTLLPNTVYVPLAGN
jgi:hypothetical protein